MLPVTLNSLIYLDLYRQIKNPFKDTKSRTMYYWLTIYSSLILSILLAAVFLSITHKINTIIFSDNSKINNIQAVITGLEMILPTYFSIFILYRLTRKGSSDLLKKKVLTRHLSYFILYFIVSYTSLMAKRWQLILNFFAGICLSLVRYSEPVIYNEIKKSLEFWF